MPKPVNRLLSGLLALFILMGLLPFAIQYVAIREVRDLGLGELTIVNTDFNPFTLKLVLDDYELRHDGRPYLTGEQLGVDLAWSDLLVGRIGIEQISSKAAEFWLRETDSAEWGLLPPMNDDGSADTEPGSPLEYALDSLLIEDAIIHVEGRQITGSFALPALNLNDLANFDAGVSNTTTEMKANWGDATMTVSTKKELMADEPPFEVILDIEGLSLSDFRQLADLPALSGIADISVRLNGNLSRSPLIASDEVLNLSAEADITVSVASLEAQDPAGVVRLSVDQSTWQGQASFSTTADVVAYELNGSLELADASVIREELVIAAWEKLTLSQINFGADNRLALAAINFDALEIMGRETPLAALNMTVADTEISSDGAVAIGRIEVTDLVSTVVIEPAGDIQAVEDINSLIEALTAGVETEAKKASDETMPIQIGEMTVEGQFHFKDKSVTPVFSQMLSIETFSLTGLNTAAPADPTTLLLESSLDEFSRFDMNVTSTLLQAMSSFDGTIKVTQLPLDKLSAYLEKSIGYEVKTGQLDVESTIKIKDQQLDASIDALLRKFRVNPAEGSDVDNELGMPLGAALKLVRDSDDNIALNGITLHGDLSDPGVSARQLIIKAVSKAMLAGTMTYFKFALQPYGAALMAAQAIGQQAAKVSLDPLMMEPRTSEIVAGHADYLDRLAELLGQRPQIHLVICGEASTTADIPEATELQTTGVPVRAVVSEVSSSLSLSSAVAGEVSGELTPVVPATEPVDHTPMLIALADERAKRIKSWLFAKGVASERLLICRSSLNDDIAGSRVVLGID